MSQIKYQVIIYWSQEDNNFIAEVPELPGWAAAEGWNPGQFDATRFYNTDPAGFFMGELEGEPIACIPGVSYGASVEIP
ncbi:hypothetical protein RIF25_06200 [Thermosynechococcaceae cyanobacterium BACA0444]|uniref:Uncharacterized protein n=1 Tax=Pseudocalidococcus azoricus BACA0444 TaxID=2918990 RepID=A0AAE4JZ31_9CYAN|nr:hypothetical protein [Pseudocalidococcus azoricus]MDS3860397.1 hypothetical protein [Pseudocalidococcus azoricus BACA0444]